LWCSGDGPGSWEQGGDFEHTKLPFCLGEWSQYMPPHPSTFSPFVTSVRYSVMALGDLIRPTKFLRSGEMLTFPPLSQMMGKIESFAMDAWNAAGCWSVIWSWVLALVGGTAPMLIWANFLSHVGLVGGTCKVL
jgi:hypothetical protein